MNYVDMFNLGNKFMTEGNMQMAVQMWQEVIKSNPEYGPAHINMSSFLRSQNNDQGELAELDKAMECPLTGKTLDMIPTIKARIAEIQAKLKGQTK